MSNAYEALVRWYLRFNGYLGVENFVVHEAIEEGNRQGGETDIIAVRFPYSQEVVGSPIVNDERHMHEIGGFRIENHNLLFDEEIAEDNLIDFVIAEVKSSKGRSDLSKIWTRREEQYVQRIAYIVRWMGFLSDEASIYRLASDLNSRFRAREGKYLVRFIYFSRGRKCFVSKQGIPQITIAEVLDFIFRVRTPSYARNDLGVRSPHDQWDPLIKQIWNIGDPTLPDSDEERRNKAVDLLESWGK